MSFFVVARFARNFVRSVDAKERERQREKKGGKSAHKIRIFFPSDFLSLSLFFSQTLNTWENFFFEKSKGKRKNHATGGLPRVYSRVRKEKSEETKRKVDATTTCRDDPSSLEKKRRGGEKSQGKEEGEEHEKARE